jgi:rubrerythrin
VASGYAWLTDGPPETVARELVYRFMTQREALLIARAAEERAKSFFRHAARIAHDPQVRALADEMAAEEDGHIALIDDMLQRTPASGVDWAALYESGA